MLIDYARQTISLVMIENSKFKDIFKIQCNTTYNLDQFKKTNKKLIVFAKTFYLSGLISFNNSIINIITTSFMLSYFLKLKEKTLNFLGRRPLELSTISHNTQINFNNFSCHVRDIVTHGTFLTKYFPGWNCL